MVIWEKWGRPSWVWRGWAGRREKEEVDQGCSMVWEHEGEAIHPDSNDEEFAA